jgi:uncharacterized repeat protein (TIGR01451 family)
MSRASTKTPAVNRDVSAQSLAPTLSFEKTPGSEAEFIARGKGTLVLSKDSVVLAANRLSKSTSRTARRDMRMKFAGANRALVVSGEEELPGKVYYTSGQFLGSLAGNPTFRRVRYSGLYNGIDAVFYGSDRELEFDFQVAPHSDPSQIRLLLVGATQITLEASGDLSLVAGGEQVRLKKPAIYQRRDGIRTEIAGGYRLSRTRSEVTFELGPYNHDLPLIIDPAVLFATYLGGGGNEFIVQLKANSSGDAYLMGGSSQSSTLPSHQIFTIAAQAVSSECFLTKLSADGTTALYTVVFAGATCGAMEVTNNSKVHISVAGAGSLTHTVRTLTESSMSLGALQGGYTISLGTFQSFAVHDMRVDSGGNLYLIVAFGASSGVVYELQKVNPQGQLLGKVQLLVATVYADGSIPDQVGGGLPGALDVDDAGHAYVIGLVRTAGVVTPTANAFRSTMLVKQAPFTNYRSDFLMRVNTTTANAFQIDYATFFGGSKDDPVSAVAFDPSSNDVVVAGTTNSPEFPATPGIFAPSYDVVDNPYEGFLLKFDLSQPPAQQLIYGTFINPFSNVYSLTMLPGGLPVIAGIASDSAVGDNPFPLVNSLYPPQFTYKNRQFLSVFSPDAKSLMFSTFLDSAPAPQSFYPLLASNGVQTLYEATSTNFPGLSTSLSFQPSIVGGTDLFVRALDASDLIAAASARADLALTATASPAPVTVGSVLAYSITVTNMGPQDANTTSLTFALPANVTFQGVTAGQGSCQTPAVGTTGTITCSLGTIANGAAVQLSVSVTAQATGPATASLKVATSTPDPILANNTANLATTVNGANNQVQLTTATTGSGSGSVTVSPSGTSCGVDCVAYDSGTTVTVTATPYAGSSFTGFTGGGCGSANTCSFTMTASTTVTATFTLNQYQLTIARAANGSGSVTVSPSGISCGVNCMAYTYGTRVSVTATASVGSSFTGFTGGGCGTPNPCSFAITASTTVTTSFTLNQYQLTTATDGNGSGSVTVSPGGVSCGVNCTTYNYGTTVTVTATPTAGSSFIGFSADRNECVSVNPCSFTITASTSITATFGLIQLTTATIGSGSGSVTVSPSGASCGVNCMAYNSGTTVTVTATPSPGSSFDGFGFSGGGCSSTNPCSFAITASTAVTATFSLASPATGFEGYLYALVDVTNSDNKLYRFRVESTGALTPLGPLGIGDSGSGVFGTERLAYDAHHRRLYVLHDGFHYVSTHVVDLGSGILTLESGPSVTSGSWDCAALNPGGSPLLVGDGSLGKVASFAEPGNDPTLPTILSGGVSTGTARPFSCVFSQDGKFVYAGGNGNTNGGGTTIAGFGVNSATGDVLPVPGSPFDVGSSVAAPYATDAAGRLFAADTLGGLLRVFTTSGGVPSSVTNSPFSSGLSLITHAVLHPDGLFILADVVGDRIGVYQVAGNGPDTTLTAVAGSPFPSGGTGPRVLALSDTGDLLFAANSTSRNIASFGVDASGHLTSVGTQAPNALGTAGVVTGLAFVPIHQPATLPPSIAETFGSSTIELGGNTALTFTLANPNSWYLSGVAFTDPLPAGTIVANSNPVTNSCGGTLTVATNLSSIALANGTIPASGTCTISATITGQTVGSWTNVTGNITSTESGTGGTASATLTIKSLVSISVTPANPAIAPGDTQQFTATGTYTDSSTQNVTGRVTWGSATPSVATITAGGMATGVGSGPSLITATLGTISGSTTLTVSNSNPPPPPPPPPTCGCTKTGAFVDPQVAGLKDTSQFATVNPDDGGQLTLTTPGSTPKSLTSTGAVSAHGFSPNGKFFVLVTKVPQVSLTLYSVDTKAAVGSIHDLTSVLSWGFSPDDDNQFFLVTSSTNVNTQAIIDIYRTDTGARVVETTANYTAVPDWTSSDSAIVQKASTSGLGGWGFSPDGYTFLLSYTSSAGPLLSLWNLTRTNNSPIHTESPFGPSFWKFSPCGDLLMVVLQTGANPASGDEVRFLYTSNGQRFNPSTISLIGGAVEPSAMVVANADGSREIVLAGMDHSTLASPQCSCAYSVFSPANIVLMDQQGRRAGFDAATGGAVNQIAGGSYTGVGSEPQTIFVPFVAGAYQLDAIGLDSLTSPQPYHLTFVAMDATGEVFDRVELAGMASRRSDDSFVFSVGNGPITPQLTPHDVAPPDVRCGPPDGLWHSSDATVACIAGDVTSGLANQADAAFALSTHVATGVETNNASTDSRVVCDKSGNCANVGPVRGNKVDKKAPSLVITAPAGTYVLGQAVAASYSCADGGSGMASCNGPVPNGAQVDTQMVGANSFSVKASDNVGNASSAVANYTVAYRVCSLYTPVAKQSGSTYPIKIQLCDAGGSNLSSPSITVHAVSVTKVSSNTTAALDDTGNANPDLDFRYDMTLAGYMFNLSTKGYVTGTYSLNFRAGADSTIHSVLFAIK